MVLVKKKLKKESISDKTFQEPPRPFEGVPKKRL